MNKLIIGSLVVLSQISNAQELHGVETTYWEHKPMVEGNRRIDELIEWDKLHPGVMPPLTEQEKYELFEKQGLPIPDSGVQIKSYKDFKYSDEQSKVVKINRLMIKSKGYIKVNNNNAKNLLEIEKIAHEELSRTKSIYLNPEDTHLRTSSYDLKMNYDYKGISGDYIDSVIGFAPESNFVQNGWNGAVEFFKPKDFDSVCAYHQINIKKTGSSVIIPKEIVTHDINHKITTHLVEGNNDSGFLYQLEWWDNEYRNQLECANELYSEELLNKTLAIAKKIDAELNN